MVFNLLYLQHSAHATFSFLSPTAQDQLSKEEWKDEWKEERSIQLGEEVNFIRSVHSCSKQPMVKIQRIVRSFCNTCLAKLPQLCLVAFRHTSFQVFMNTLFGGGSFARGRNFLKRKHYIVKTKLNFVINFGYGKVILSQKEAG